MGVRRDQNPLTPARAHVIISGRVQGVFFRSSTQKKAQKLQLTGWVRNAEDGTVEAVFEGEEKNVKKMIEWCHHGPTFADVDYVEITWEDYKKEYRLFGVR
jgi:acylphosphatase